MTMKKKKFATTLLTTALLTCGFALETAAEPRAEVHAPTEVSAMKKETKQQDLVSSEPTKRKIGQTSPENAQRHTANHNRSNVTKSQKNPTQPKLTNRHPRTFYKKSSTTPTNFVVTR